MAERFFIEPLLPFNICLPAILEIGSGTGFAIAAIKAPAIQTLKAWMPAKGRFPLPRASKKRELPVEHVPVMQTRAYLDFLLYNCGFCGISAQEASANKFPPPLPSLSGPSVIKWFLRTYFSAHRRLELASESGRTEAKRLPLSPNIVAIAAGPL